MPSATTTAFGAELRRWRTARRHSQLSLSTAAGVSQRHLSHLETGRSNPSREMVDRLSEALDVPLRARNDLLTAAGFAPAHPVRSLLDDERAAIRTALQSVLDGHDPVPAYVIDRNWDLVLANAATARLTGLLPDPAAAAAAARGNVLRLLLHPDGLRPHVLNIGEVTTVLVDRLRREVGHHGGDPELAALLDEVSGYAGPSRDPVPPTARDLVVPLHLRLGGHDLRLVTMIATVGAPHDVTLEELRLETLLPLDAATTDALQAIAGVDR